MAPPTTQHPQSSHAPHHDGAQFTFHTDFACVACAQAVERTLRAHPHVTAVHVDYPARTVHVTAHPGMVSEQDLATTISTSAHGCRCTTEADQPAGAERTGGDLSALAHAADMAAVTLGTAADRMQYEFPSTAAGKAHHAAHSGQGPALAVPPPASAPPLPPGRDHGSHHRLISDRYANGAGREDWYGCGPFAG